MPELNRRLRLTVTVFTYNADGRFASQRTETLNVWGQEYGSSPSNFVPGSPSSVVRYTFFKNYLMRFDRRIVNLLWDPPLETINAVVLTDTDGLDWTLVNAVNSTSAPNRDRFMETNWEREVRG